MQQRPGLHYVRLGGSVSARSISRKRDADGWTKPWLEARVGISTSRTAPSTVNPRERAEATLSHVTSACATTNREASLFNTPFGFLDVCECRAASPARAVRVCLRVRCLFVCLSLRTSRRKHAPRAGRPYGVAAARRGGRPQRLDRGEAYTRPHSGRSSQFQRLERLLGADWRHSARHTGPAPLPEAPKPSAARRTARPARCPVATLRCTRPTWPL